MAKACRDCGCILPDTASTCERCGSSRLGVQVADEPNRRRSWIGYIVPGLFGLTVVLLFVIFLLGPVPEPTASRPKPPQPTVLSPSEHFSEAKALLKHSLDISGVIEAEDHLNAIPAEVAEYKQAQRLKREVESRRREIQKEADAEQNPLRVVSSSWRKGGFETVGLWTVTFENVCSRPVGNIKYRTSYFSETGNLVTTGGFGSVLGDGVIQKIVGPKSQRTIEINDGFIHHEASRAQFDVIGWEFVR